MLLCEPGAGIVHRDLKPANIVKVTIEDLWKLIDMATSAEDDLESAVHYTLRWSLFQNGIYAKFN